MKQTRFKNYSIGSLTASEIKSFKPGDLITLSNGHRLKCYLETTGPRSSKRCWFLEGINNRMLNCYFSNCYSHSNIQCPIPCVYKRKGEDAIQVRFVRVRGMKNTKYR